MSDSPDLQPHIEAIARAFLGKPNKRLSTGSQLRFGSNGSVSVEIAGSKRGQWYDHETKQGGGPWELLTIKAGMANGTAIKWLESELGIEIPRAVKGPRDPVAIYDYHDEHGKSRVSGLPVRAKDLSATEARREGRLDLERQRSAAATLSPPRAARCAG
jgi:hypothetical protein